MYRDSTIRHAGCPSTMYRCVCLRAEYLCACVLPVENLPSHTNAGRVDCIHAVRVKRVGRPIPERHNADTFSSCPFHSLCPRNRDHRSLDPPMLHCGSSSPTNPGNQSTYHQTM